ncbi:SRPBCC family protein [Leucobacter allii]|uniref:SRPBCC family protein n=1 Tax=Leucobacter allii TaxID=2932247 RepID=UPI001FD02EF4|nr:SRPBCC family protein [Leucobacter allii]UOR01582.1 SRPBCC family protein [Leucobacter allii]
MAAEERIVAAERVVAAEAAEIFELIADPARQPEWDGNGNLTAAGAGQRVRAVGDVFTMTIHTGEVRENRVVEFVEGRRIAWLPSPVGLPEPGHLWRWELEPLASGGTLVRHGYDWSGLTDETRFARARANTAEALRASIDRLAGLVETADDPRR